MDLGKLLAEALADAGVTVSIESADTDQALQAAAQQFVKRVEAIEMADSAAEMSNVPTSLNTPWT